MLHCNAPMESTLWNLLLDSGFHWLCDQKILHRSRCLTDHFYSICLKEKVSHGLRSTNDRPARYRGRACSAGPLMALAVRYSSIRTWGMRGGFRSSQGTIIRREVGDDTATPLPCQGDGRCGVGVRTSRIIARRPSAQPLGHYQVKQAGCRPEMTSHHT